MEAVPKFFAAIATMAGTIWCTWTSWVLLVGGSVPLMDVSVQGSVLASLAFFVVVEPLVLVALFYGTYYLFAAIAVTLWSPVLLGQAWKRMRGGQTGQGQSIPRSLSETEEDLDRRLRLEQKYTSPAADARQIEVGEIAHFRNGVVRFRESLWRRGLGTVSSLRVIREEDVHKEWFVFDQAALPSQSDVNGEVCLDAEDVRTMVRRSPDRQSDLQRLFAELRDLRNRIAETGATRTWGGWTTDEDSRPGS